MFDELCVADGEMRRTEGEADLCVAHSLRQAATAELHEFEILRAGMQNDGRGVVQDVVPRHSVCAIQWVIQMRVTARLAGLHQGEFGDVAVLAHKFAVVAEDVVGVKIFHKGSRLDTARHGSMNNAVGKVCFAAAFPYNPRTCRFTGISLPPYGGFVYP